MTIMQSASPMNLRLTDGPDPAPSPGRFTYAGGSQPLAGFTIKRGVGHGGFGEVYYAVSDAGKEVALKLIRRNLDIEIRGVTQCLNLKHPNLVSLFDIRQGDRDESWVVMEFVKGPSLEQTLAEHPTGLPLDEAMAWIQGIAAGVAYLHDHGIVHRDLKPGNIFREDGIVKIGDYGLSKFISCSRRSGQTGSVGTVHYMAPEVANGRYGKEIDVYAVGIVLFEMLSGNVPFEGESMGEVLMKHLTAQPDLKGVPEPFRKAIAGSLAKDPDLRLHSMGQFMALLPPVAPANFAAGAIPLATPVGGPHPGGVPPFKPTAHSTIPEEPILGFLRGKWREGRAWWLSTPLAPWQRTLISVAVICALVLTLHAWAPLMVSVAIVYGIYRLIRAIVMPAPQRLVVNTSPQAQGSPPPSPIPVAQAAPGPIPVATAAGPLPPPVGSAKARQWRNGMRATMPGYGMAPPRPPRERMVDLLGSLILSAVVALVSTLAMAALRGAASPGATIEPNQYAWLAITSIAGAWLVLVPARLWEGRREEQSLRRFVMLVMGLAIGAGAYLLHNWLLVYLPYDQALQPHMPGVFHRENLYLPNGTPTLLTFLAVFGSAMILPRWWRQADRARPTRFSFWKVVSAVFWAAIVNAFWPFPQPWGYMVIATISIAVQMASPVAVRTDGARY